ncbi:uncharacterized protein MONBRDRAFT_36900 [Monosiga brevicollis MX1]|uniref:Protein kinase domain-containing protein n=1 Tax=Monosiga brevicollis TaxID=81824 RepID=A9UXM3_MONBE|nr:uncharacterized protein MONBRDRAFT_36900 [Monosiga brevicollis MX1]EDQ90034.1 predicted protein [Monosiga brevicollis MX1]|eukprot:XP_001745456.1 hypothetical protein [Monosiga brevicollis MX1]
MTNDEFLSACAAIRSDQALKLLKKLPWGSPLLHAVFEYHNADDMTPLHYACWYGQKDIARLLLDAGADRNARDYAPAPLLQACRQGHLEAVKAQLAAGADVHQCNEAQAAIEAINHWLLPLARAVATAPVPEGPPIVLNAMLAFACTDTAPALNAAVSNVMDAQAWLEWLPSSMPQHLDATRAIINVIDDGVRAQDQVQTRIGTSQPGDSLLGVLGEIQDVVKALQIGSCELDWSHCTKALSILQSTMPTTQTAHPPASAERLGDSLLSESTTACSPSLESSAHSSTLLPDDRTPSLYTLANALDKDTAHDLKSSSIGLPELLEKLCTARRTLAVVAQALQQAEVQARNALQQLAQAVANYTASLADSLKQDGARALALLDGAKGLDPPTPGIEASQKASDSYLDWRPIRDAHATLQHLSRSVDSPMRQAVMAAVHCGPHMLRQLTTMAHIEQENLSAQFHVIRAWHSDLLASLTVCQTKARAHIQQLAAQDEGNASTTDTRHRILDQIQSARRFLDSGPPAEMQTMLLAQIAQWEAELQQLHSSAPHSEPIVELSQQLMRHFSDLLQLVPRGPQDACARLQAQLPEASPQLALEILAQLDADVSLRDFSDETILSDSNHPVSRFTFAPADGPTHTVAVKAYSLLQRDKHTTLEQRCRTILREVTTLRSLQHEHILHLELAFFDVHAKAPRIYLVLPWCPERDLGHWLQNVTAEAVTAKLAWRLMQETQSALAYIHKAGLVHRDVKLSNIMLAGKHNDPQAKLGDFDITRPAAERTFLVRTTLAAVGTDGYIAPELLFGRGRVGARPSQDAFALGCVFYNVYSFPLRAPAVSKEGEDLRTALLRNNDGTASVAPAVASCKFPKLRHELELVEGRVHQLTWQLLAPSPHDRPKLSAGPMESTLLQPALGTEPGALDPPMTKVLLEAPELLDEVNALLEQIAASDAQALVVTRVQRVVNTLVWRRYMRRLEEMQQRQPIQTEHVCETLLTGHLEAITGSVPLFRDGACQERLLFMSAPISNDKRNHVVRLGFDTRFHPATTSQGHGIWLSDDPLQLKPANPMATLHSLVAPQPPNAQLSQPISAAPNAVRRAQPPASDETLYVPIICIFVVTGGNSSKSAASQAAIAQTWFTNHSYFVTHDKVPVPSERVVYLSTSAEQAARVNLALKVLHMWEYLARMRTARFAQCDYFMKADDDTYVNLPRLQQELALLNASVPSYFGVKRYSAVVKNTPPANSLWPPKNSLNFGHGGAGYLLSRAALAQLGPDALAACRHSPPLLSLEDARLAACLYQQLGLDCTNLQWMSFGGMDPWHNRHDQDRQTNTLDAASDLELIKGSSFHSIRADLMKRLHHRLQAIDPTVWTQALQRIGDQARTLLAQPSPRFNALYRCALPHEATSLEGACHDSLVAAPLRQLAHAGVDADALQASFSWRWVHRPSEPRQQPRTLFSVVFPLTLTLDMSVWLERIWAGALAPLQPDIQLNLVFCDQLPEKLATEAKASLAGVAAVTVACQTLTVGEQYLNIQKAVLAGVTWASQQRDQSLDVSVVIPADASVSVSRLRLLASHDRAILSPLVPLQQVDRIIFNLAQLTALADNGQARLQGTALLTTAPATAAGLSNPQRDLHPVLAVDQWPIESRHKTAFQRFIKGPDQGQYDLIFSHLTPNGKFSGRYEVVERFYEHLLGPHATIAAFREPKQQLTSYAYYYFVPNHREQSQAEAFVQNHLARFDVTVLSERYVSCVPLHFDLCLACIADASGNMGGGTGGEGSRFDESLVLMRRLFNWDPLDITYLRLLDSHAKDSHLLNPFSHPTPTPPFDSIRAGLKPRWPKSRTLQKKSGCFRNYKRL